MRIVTFSPFSPSTPCPASFVRHDKHVGSNDAEVPDAVRAEPRGRGDDVAGGCLAGVEEIGICALCGGRHGDG